MNRQILLHPTSVVPFLLDAERLSAATRQALLETVRDCFLQYDNCKNGAAGPFEPAGENRWSFDILLQDREDGRWRNFWFVVEESGPAGALTIIYVEERFGAST
jgi:hypothetical protein